LKKDGTLDMRYKVCQEWKAKYGTIKPPLDGAALEQFTKIPRKKDGTLDMRFKAAQDYAATNGGKIHKPLPTLANPATAGAGAGAGGAAAARAPKESDSRMDPIAEKNTDVTDMTMPDWAALLPAQRSTRASILENEGVCKLVVGERKFNVDRFVEQCEQHCALLRRKGQGDMLTDDELLAVAMYVNKQYPMYPHVLVEKMARRQSD